MRWVEKVQMKTLAIAGYNRTRFFGMIAHGDDIIEGNVEVFFYVVRGVLADINAIVHHHLFGHRIDKCFHHAGTVYLGFVAGKMT